MIYKYHYLYIRGIINAMAGPLQAAKSEQRITNRIRISLRRAPFLTTALMAGFHTVPAFNKMPVTQIAAELPDVAVIKYP